MHTTGSLKESSSRKPLWRWPNELPIEGEPANVVEAVENYNSGSSRQTCRSYYSMVIRV